MFGDAERPVAGAIRSAARLQSGNCHGEFHRAIARRIEARVGEEFQRLRPFNREWLEARGLLGGGAAEARSNQAYRKDA